ncbi:MAG: site-specific integrase [Spirosomataceae bacterium]
MAKFNFNLRRQTSYKPEPIYLVIRYANRKLVYPTGEAILPEHWDTKTQRPKKVESLRRKFPELRDLDTILSDFERRAKQAFSNYLANNANQYPLPDDFKLMLDRSIKGRDENLSKGTKTGKVTLFDFIEEFIKDRPNRLNPTTQEPYSELTIRSYKATLAHLKDFVSSNRLKYRSLDFAGVDLNFYYDFTEYLANKKKQTTNTVGKQIKNLKVFLNDALERGITEHDGFKGNRFKVVKEEIDHIYLNENELYQLYRLDLSQNSRLERVRDLFLVGCWTGLRFGDLTAIHKDNFRTDENGDMLINILTKKTSKEVWIPVHPMVKAIRERYQDKTPNSLPPTVSIQKMNLFLKELGKLAELEEQISSTKTKGGKRVTLTKPKYELISTHTCRRSFATNQYAMGVPAYSIMQVTGHKTESVFLKYIKFTPKQHAQKMAEVWEQQRQQNPFRKAV